MMLSNMELESLKKVVIIYLICFSDLKAFCLVAKLGKMKSKIILIGYLNLSFDNAEIP